jgi:protein-tyrosine phosphatase
VRTDFFWIPTTTPGRLAVLARPRGGDWLGDEVAGWKRTGVDVVVSLLTPSEETEFDLMSEADLARDAGIRFGSLPVPDRGVPPSREVVAELAARLAADLAAGKTVIVHCRQGIGRAGMLAAAVLTTLGMDLDAALRAIEAARGRPVPETADQRQWLAEFATRLPQPAR